jgi:hypothetical protein
MAREGFVLNLIGVAIISTVAMFLVSKASKGVDPEMVPDAVSSASITAEVGGDTL